MITTGMQPTSRKRDLLLIGRVPSAVAPICGAGSARDVEPMPVRGSAP